MEAAGESAVPVQTRKRDERREQERQQAIGPDERLKWLGRPHQAASRLSSMNRPDQEVPVALSRGRTVKNQRLQAMGIACVALLTLERAHVCVHEGVFCAYPPFQDTREDTPFREDPFHDTREDTIETDRIPIAAR